eukprot:1039788-Rhodomonas_salina.3
MPPMRSHHRGPNRTQTAKTLIHSRYKNRSPSIPALFEGRGCLRVVLRARPGISRGCYGGISVTGDLRREKKERTGQNLILLA